MVGKQAQILRAGEWVDGWVVADASNLHNVRVEKLGSPNVTISRLRWDMDVRLKAIAPETAAEPLEAPVEASEPTDDDHFTF